ncbi:Initiator tRNA phosphoribosyl transferase [Ophiocordyceps sinensis CO18]|uniref:Initiator tRNA phosphoribosyl transferase n=1 Tax=Ophiocordyceps sinensis (strain Co18 / CGMCC 3.14243) TaxID=911162 RepID=T5AGR7_OPHSC|nr:Initiator tRNA phosphoribosyl transferase [Ophiocordyceps sinensis CO18]
MLPADLIFPHQPSLSELLSSLRRSTLSIHNRLVSIRADAAFVARAASALSANDHGPASCSSSRGRRPRPLVANERCGSWYVPPDRKAASAYFKSTDGHERAWKFSTRRLNLHLVDMIEDNDGYHVPHFMLLTVTCPSAGKITGQYSAAHIVET